MNEGISVAISEGIALITLDRPEKLNALTVAMFDRLASLFGGELAADRTLRCVVLTGAGGRAFSAGAVVTEARPETPPIADYVAGQDRVHQFFNSVEAFARPVIAALNGLTLGGGLELAMCADIRCAARSARMGLPEVKLGVLPGAGGTQRLPRLVGASRAKELIFTGRMIDAETARDWGLVDHVHEDAELMARTMTLAREIAAQPPLPVFYAKRAINYGLQVWREAGLEYERHAAAVVVNSEDAREGMQAFAQKRPPRFTGH